MVSVKERTKELLYEFYEKFKELNFSIDDNFPDFDWEAISDQCNDLEGIAAEINRCLKKNQNDEYCPFNIISANELLEMKIPIRKEYRWGYITKDGYLAEKIGKRKVIDLVRELKSGRFNDTDHVPLLILPVKCEDLEEHITNIIHNYLKYTDK